MASVDSLNNIGFYIPTYNRGIEKQKTFQQLPFYLRNRINFVVYKNEAKEFKKIGNVMVADCEIGIANKRQFVIDTAKEKYIFFMDDDCEFSIRKGKKLKKANRKEVGEMFLLLCKWLKTDKFGQVGISFRSINFAIKEKYKEVQNVYSMFGFNRELFNSLGLKCNNSVFLEDMQITLGLISKGYKNRVSYEYAIHQVSGQDGGCSTYRTHKNQKQSVLAVNKLFPKHTTIIRRTGKDDGWRDYDLRVKWREAYNQGVSLTTRKKKLSFL